MDQHDKVVHVESLFFLRFTLLAGDLSALNDRKDNTDFQAGPKMAHCVHPLSRRAVTA